MPDTVDAALNEELTSRYGEEWNRLYATRLKLQSLMADIDESLITIEQRDFLTGPETIAAQHHTVEMNRSLWDGWDWSYLGEEWTAGVAELDGRHR